MAGFHHGISAQEVTQGILPMRNANVSVLGLIVISSDADDAMYPVGTPVLLTGITQDNIDKAGTDGTLRDCLQTIRDIHNPTVVVLRVSQSFEADSLDVLLTCPARFGLMPKRFGAPELDTPDVVLKLVSIAKRRRGIVYASPRKPDGTLITDKAAIVAYRDTYGDREICIIDGEWGVPTNSESVSCTPTTLGFVPKVILPAGKEQIILRAVLEVNGEAVFHYNGDDGFADLSVDTGTLDFNNESTPEWIANYLFLYSGIDLMRQMNVRNCFDYSPNGDLAEGQSIYLWGLEENVPDGMLSLPRIPADVKLTFKVIDNLPSNAVDFTLEQWGQDVSVYGCAIYDQSNAPQ